MPNRTEKTPLLTLSQRVTHSVESKQRLIGRTYFSPLFNDGERQEAMLHKGVGQAAFLIRDAIIGQEEDPADGAYDPYQYPSQQFRHNLSIVCRRWCAYRPVVQFITMCCWCLVLLTLIEPPPWCRQASATIIGNETTGTLVVHGCEAILSLEGIPADNNNSTTETVLLYPNSKSMLLTETESYAAEAFLLLIRSLFTLLQIGRDGMSLPCFLRPGPAQTTRLTQLLCLATLTAGLLTGITHHHPYARFLLLMTHLPGLQRNVVVLLHVMPEIFNILMLLFVIMVFYAWFGAVMFLNTAQGQLFSDFIESLWNLYIMVTTANYPDVMMPAYNQNRWSGLYFVSFMLLSYFFFMNIVLASVVNEYTQAAKAQQKIHTQQVVENLEQAYHCLDSDQTGRVDRNTIMALFWILNKDFPEFPTLSHEDSQIIFAILDRDGSSTITKDEFLDFGNIVMLEFIKTSDYATMVQMNFPHFFQSRGYQYFCQLVKSSSFEFGIDLILFLNAIVIAIQSYPELAGKAVVIDPKYWDGSIDTVWELMESIFTAIYLVEVLLKILVLGKKAYFERTKNIFDFTVTVLAVISTALVYYPNDISDSRLVRMIVTARVLRLIRLLTALQRFQLIGSIIAETAPKAVNVILLLLSLTFLFAAMGVQLYGGLITRDPSNDLSHLILGTDFSESEYWANNFNDYISSINVLFNLLVVNNWNVCEIGFEAVTNGKWVRIYFIAFFILGVIFINNLVIAFVINSFLEQLVIFQQRTDYEIVGDGEAVIEHRKAYFNATQVTGTKTNLTGHYIARMRKAVSNISEGNEQDKLRQLFTQSSYDENGGSDKMTNC